MMVHHPQSDVQSSCSSTRDVACKLLVLSGTSICKEISSSSAAADARYGTA